MKSYNLEGVRSYEINLLPDERGFFAEALRIDWNDFIIYCLLLPILY